MDMPAEVRLKATIRPGSVFYFKEESWSANYGHNFVVLNYNPATDDALILVGATTLDIKIFYRMKQFPKETIVDVIPENCQFLTRPSYFNCNNVIQKKIEHLVDKLIKGELRIRHHYVDGAVLDRIRAGVKASPLVEKWIKNLL